MTISPTERIWSRYCAIPTFDDCETRLGRTKEGEQLQDKRDALGKPNGTDDPMPSALRH